MRCVQLLKAPFLLAGWNAAWFVKWCFFNALSFVALGLCCCAWLSPVVVRGYASLRFTGFSSMWLLSLWNTGSRHMGFHGCGTEAPSLWLVGPRLQAQKLWRTGLVAVGRVESSQTRDRNRVPLHWPVDSHPPCHKESL